MQGIWGTIVASVTSGSMLVTLLEAFKNSLMTNHSGSSRPVNLQAGGMWINSANAVSPTNYYSFMLYTGSTDIEVFRLSTVNNFGSSIVSQDELDVKQISDDTSQAIIELIKQRVANNGQILNGDVIGELRFVGTTATSTNPTVAYLRFTASDNMTSSASGGTLSLVSTPDASSTITEHLRLIAGQVETSALLKINSLQLVSQSIATAASIANLDASKTIVEMTGSTATDIQGMDATAASKVVTIHNRSSAVLTFKHENASATATNRFKLPSSADIQIPAGSSATFYYCAADARWKIKDSANPAPVVPTIEILSGVGKTWTAPSTTSRISITCYPKAYGLFGHDQFGSSSGAFFVDAYGNQYAWGQNVFGELGVGDLTPRSSPVALFGGLTFLRTSRNITTSGKMYAWGEGFAGSLGVGDSANRSSPVAVLGNLTFTSGHISSQSSSFGLTPAGSLYAWGDHGFGQLGVGDLVSRSSPVAVLGNLKFSQFSYIEDTRTFALASDGTAYAWGDNSQGQLGVGDTVGRSSPVAVLGGLKFSKIVGLSNSNTDTATFGLTTSGDMYAWGYSSDYSQLGTGEAFRAFRSTPTAVLGGLKFANMATGSCVYALQSDGTLYAWGQNDFGELGVGDVAVRSSPVAVLGGLKFKKIISFPSTEFVFGITLDGDMYAWGANSFGQLGVGDTVSRSSPVAVLGGLKWIDAVMDGSGLVFGLTQDGTVYSWGNGTAQSAGELGQGVAAAKRSSPVAVVGPAQIGSPPTAKVITMDVIPGATYSVNLSMSGKAYFGDVQLDPDLDYITIDYLK